VELGWELGVGAVGEAVIARWVRCFGLLDSIEDHAEADRRTLAELLLEKTVQMSGTASSLIR
jgi:hypothetical protein